MTQPEARSQLDDDFAYISAFCSCYVPAAAEFDAQKNKFSKKPRVAGWNTITAEASQKLLADPRFANHRHRIFRTGEDTGLFVLDIDRKDPLRHDHANQRDGVEAYENTLGSIEAADTFTTRSIGGGYHKVFRLTDELTTYLKNGPLMADALIEVLGNKRGFFFGEGCSILHRIPPSLPPADVSRLIINNYFHTEVNISTVRNTTVITPPVMPSSDRISAALQCQVPWTITRESDDCYALVPATRQCCVVTEAQHSREGHSCVYVHRNAVVLNCFSHGKRLLRGDISRELRALFFELKSAGADGISDLVDVLLAAATEQHLARDQGMVLKRICADIPVYETVGPYDAFLTQRLANHPQLKAFPRRFNDLLVYMARVDDSSFPFVRRDRTYLGFRNAMLNLITGDLQDYSSLDPGVSPRHYIDQVCDLSQAQTPLFDRMVRYQLDTADAADTDIVYTYLLGLIGRLFYEVGRFDRFDVMPLIVGDTNTGKSTLIDVVSSMFAPQSVGVVDSSLETIFGLQAMHTKELIVAPEIPDSLAQQLASDKLKKMIGGERVTVATKHAAATTVVWQVPMLMCGNDYPRYRDERGSVSKRLAIFSFTRYVATQDSSLKQRIIATELAPLVVRCLTAYRQLLKRTGTAGFWSVCPGYFSDTTAGMHENTDYVHMFLTLGHGDNMWYDKSMHQRKVMYFVQQPGFTLWMEEFKKKFSDYMRFRHPLVKYRWTKDYSAFKRLGYVVDRRHMCRACKQPATRGCCEHFGRANRSHVDIIMNIQCVEQYLPTDE